MYLTAQRVVTPIGQQTGINVFLYSHPNRAWRIPPNDIPDKDHGKLVNKKIDVQPPGNRVQSYIDIVAPDETKDYEIVRRLLVVLRRLERQPLPWEAVEAPCLFRLWMEPELAKTWLREVSALATAALALLSGSR